MPVKPCFFCIFDVIYFLLEILLIMTKQCPRCNRIFECKHDSSCWCSRYTLTSNVRLYLQNNYKDCLCEDCINEVIEKCK